MEKVLWSILGMTVVMQSFALGDAPPILDANKDLLPSPFPVYIIENSGVINHPVAGAVKALLPTDNSYTESPGCYVACYAHKPGVYNVSPSISVMGQIRVKGQYASRVCQPESYQGVDISAEPTFKLLCAKRIPACADESCWGGGDTGGWFGVQ